MEPLDTKIGPYTLVQKIGDGGMAEVFKARVERAGGFEKIVALKKILPNLASSEKFRRNFINEARICGQLHHHNIVEVYDFLQEDDGLCLAMEFIDGLNLEEVFNYHRETERPIITDVILAILVQALEGLEYAHKAVDSIDKKPLNVIHRDLKPSNILIDNEGVVKIVDFGVAKAANRRYETQEMTAKGTASYMSPEGLLGESPVTSKADLFSMGTILYELLTLNRLFDGEHVFAILKQVAGMDIDAHLNRIIEGADRRFLPILRKSLARDPVARYDSAGQMLRDLLSLNLGSPSSRGLADHLREIRNVSESVEDARTRLVTDRDISDFMQGEDYPDAQPTRVGGEDDLGDYDEEDLETVMAVDPVNGAPAAKTEAVDDPLEPTAASNIAGGSPPAGVEQTEPTQAARTANPLPMDSGVPGKPDIAPVSSPVSSVVSPPQAQPEGHLPQVPRAMPSIMGEEGGGNRGPDVGPPGSGANPESRDIFSDSNSIRIGPLKEPVSGLVSPLAIGAGIGLVILLLIFYL